jgi:hypothetical protein
MFWIVRLLLSLAALVLLVWFGANVPLGSRTLFQHLQAIGSTRETREFFDGTRQTAQPVVDGVRKRLGTAVTPDNQIGKTVPDAGAPPAEEVSPLDRQRLRKVLGAGQPARERH